MINITPAVLEAQAARSDKTSWSTEMDFGLGHTRRTGKLIMMRVTEIVVLIHKIQIPSFLNLAWSSNYNTDSGESKVVQMCRLTGR